CQQFNSLPWTF
nr:immunoglobulin light chain junction region [Macaca mulatta]